MAESENQTLSIVQRIFSNWTGLRMAIEHGMGTNDQAQSFCEYVTELLTMNEQLHHSDVAVELEDYMDAQFDTQLEDDSEKQVAEEIVKFHRLIVKKDLESLQAELAKLPNLQPWIVNSTSKSLHPVNKNDSGSDGDDMDDGVSNDNSNKQTSSGQMDVDEDGWAVVRRKR